MALIITLSIIALYLCVGYQWFKKDIWVSLMIDDIIYSQPIEQINRDFKQDQLKLLVSPTKTLTDELYVLSKQHRSRKQTTTVDYTTIKKIVNDHT